MFDQSRVMVGVVTRKDLHTPELAEESSLRDTAKGLSKFVYDDCTVRQAAANMSNHAIGRLPVVSRTSPNAIVGIITRSDAIKVFVPRLQAAELQQPNIRVFRKPNNAS